MCQVVVEEIATSLACDPAGQRHLQGLLAHLKQAWITPHGKWHLTEGLVITFACALSRMFMISYMFECIFVHICMCFAFDVFCR